MSEKWNDFVQRNLFEGLDSIADYYLLTNELPHSQKTLIKYGFLSQLVARLIQEGLVIDKDLTDITEWRHTLDRKKRSNYPSILGISMTDHGDVRIGDDGEVVEDDEE